MNLDFGSARLVAQEGAIGDDRSGMVAFNRNRGRVVIKVGEWEVLIAVSPDQVLLFAARTQAVMRNQGLAVPYLISTCRL